MENGKENQIHIEKEKKNMYTNKKKKENTIEKRKEKWLVCDWIWLVNCERKFEEISNEI